MKKQEIIVMEKKSSPVSTVFKAITLAVAVGTAVYVAYKYVKEKFDSGILGKLDLDGDGEAETLILDTTGDGEIDTIIINSQPAEENE